MQTIKTGIAALLISPLLTTSALAETWGIQIGAFKTPNIEEIRALEARTGLTASTTTRDGYQVVSMGSFPSRDAAVAALADNRGDLASDAFVRKLAGAGSLTAQSVSAPAGKPTLADLPEHIRSRVVYLDGVLHIKEGDEFTPLSSVKTR